MNREHLSLFTDLCIILAMLAILACIFQEYHSPVVYERQPVVIPCDTDTDCEQKNPTFN